MKTFIKYIFIFIFGFFIAGSIAYYSVTLFTKSADEVVLPELKGKNIIYVLETLTNMGLNAKLYGTNYHETIPIYSVISQDPEPGATIKKGRDIVFYLSKGKKENIIPDLRQTALKSAILLLEQNEFKPGQISYTYSSTTKKDQILTQYPIPFSTALKNSVCNLLVSRGPIPEALVMPKIQGSKIDKAYTFIEDHNLSIAKIVSNRDTTFDFGVILSQIPEAGSHVTSDTPIQLVVNNSDKNKVMDPKKLTGVMLLTHSMSPGFLKKHVRVETNLFGPIITLYNEYMKPEKDINILIPSGVHANIDIYIDQILIKTITIDPWKKDTETGDTLLWESLPPQFYPQISPDLVMN